MDGTGRFFFCRVLVFAVLCCITVPLYAQEIDTTNVVVPEAGQERVLVRPDTLVGDTVRVATPVRPASPLKEPVQFAAQDSLVIVFDEEGGDTGTLVGQARVTYGDATLDAHAIDILFEIDELRARPLDADTGRAVFPRFTEGDESFTGLSLAYNLRTERGRVVGARTTLEDGFIEAGVAKVTEDSTLYVLDGSYTTCECDIGETPSYSLRSSKMKIVDGERIYTGPIRLYLFNIPTPLWLPFGVLPATEGRRSGPLWPQYGEDTRGFYLRGWGWYQAINDYTDLQLRGGLWSKGSWQVNPIFRYIRRYRYNGQLNVDYLRELSGERSDPDLQVQSRASLRWNHSQTISPSSSLTANVDLTSSGYLRTVSQQYSDNVRQTVTSSVAYNKQWRASGRSLSASLRQNQVLATGETDLILPGLSFRQSSRTPFKRERRAPGEDERWYERITTSYTGRLDNRFAFDPLPDDTLLARGDTSALGIAWYDALVSPGKYRRATGDATPYDLTASHNIPISASFSLNRGIRLNLTPNFTYDEDWFIQTERQRVDSTGVTRRENVPGFFALRQFNTGVSANTTFYGLFPFRAGPFDGVRHTVRPTLSFNYRPDYFGDFWGYSRVLRDESGEPVIVNGEAQRYGVVSNVPRGEQQNVSFSVANVFESRRVRTDTTGTVQRRTFKLFDLNLAANYNFAADSLRLSPIRVDARTRILDRLGINLGLTYSPYARRVDAAGRVREIDRYLFAPGAFRFARLTSARVSADMRLSGGGGGLTPGVTPGLPGAPGFGQNGGVFGEQDPFGIDYADPNIDADFSIPWSLGLSFTYSVNRAALLSTRTATLNTTFDLNLTPRWKVQGSSGFDIAGREIVSTRLYIVRDFECWQMSLNWVPFGDFQQYGFDLHVKSGQLRDILRLRQPRQEIGDRFGETF